MNIIKKIWKTKIRVLLPGWLKQMLSFAGNGFRRSNVFRTTDRNEFLKEVTKLFDNQQFTPPTHAIWHRIGGRNKKIGKPRTLHLYDTKNCQNLYWKSLYLTYNPIMLFAIWLAPAAIFRFLSRIK
jgi:hypothetical protein